MVDDLDFTKPERVRPAPGCPNILVAHLSVAPKPYVYVGRQMPGVPASPLGNPYRPGPGVDAIESFRSWLRDAYRDYKRLGDRARQDRWQAGRELERMAELYRAGERLALACWCAEVYRDRDGNVISSAPCHADVIAEAVVGIVAQSEAVLISVAGAGDCTLQRAGEGWELLRDGAVLRRAATLAEARAPFETEPAARRAA